MSKLDTTVPLRKVAFEQISAAGAEMDNSLNNWDLLLWSCLDQMLGHAKAVTQACITAEQTARPGSGQNKWAFTRTTFRK